MKILLNKNLKAFTLVELMVTLLMVTIVILGVGIIMVDSQRGFNRMYDRVHGDVATGIYVAQKGFESVIRIASINRSLLDVDGQFVEVYYYNDFTSIKPDKYANFYSIGSSLLVDYGTYDWDERKATLSTTVTLANNIKAVNFSIRGLAVQMVLTLDDENESATVVTTALRHN